MDITFIALSVLLTWCWEVLGHVMPAADEPFHAHFVAKMYYQLYIFKVIALTRTHAFEFQYLSKRETGARFIRPSRLVLGTPRDWKGPACRIVLLSIVGSTRKNAVMELWFSSIHYQKLPLKARKRNDKAVCRAKS